MRILTVSDVVVPRLYPEVDKDHFGRIDLLLGCGDLPPEYLTFLTHTFNVPLFYVKGNHDIRYAGRPPQGCRNIHERVVTHGGLKFMGLEGSMWYNGGPHQYTEKQMTRMIRRMRPVIWWRGGGDVVVTHAPPRGIHDGTDLCHRGFDSYRGLIQKYHPAHFIHGHIHRRFENEAARRTYMDRTCVINSYGYTILETAHA
ncbi:MAG: metallophosphoesterase [Desulfosarcina sp.]|nr:metallophosphoesterase [Desulfobacterales bacterium]